MKFRENSNIKFLEPLTLNKSTPIGRAPMGKAQSNLAWTWPVFFQIIWKSTWPISFPTAGPKISSKLLFLTQLFISIFKKKFQIFFSEKIRLSKWDEFVVELYKKFCSKPWPTCDWLMTQPACFSANQRRARTSRLTNQRGAFVQQSFEFELPRDKFKIHYFLVCFFFIELFVFQRD